MYYVPRTTYYYYYYSYLLRLIDYIGLINYAVTTYDYLQRLKGFHVSSLDVS